MDSEWSWGCIQNEIRKEFRMKSGFNSDWRQGLIQNDSISDFETEAGMDPE